MNLKTELDADKEIAWCVGKLKHHREHWALTKNPNVLPSDGQCGLMIEALERALIKAVEPTEGLCLWKHDEFHDCYDTQCGKSMAMEHGTPKDNKYNFCPCCGGEIVYKPAESGNTPSSPSAASVKG